VFGRVSGLCSGFLDFARCSRNLIGVLMFCPEFRVLGGPTKNPEHKFALMTIFLVGPTKTQNPYTR
jgi:hypothetical protein